MKLRRHVPDAVRTVNDRRLAWAVTIGDVALVASPTCLYVGQEMLPWTSVEKVTWKPPMLTVHEVAEVEGTGAVRTFEVVEDHKIAETIRERVTTSVAWSDLLALQPAGRVRLVGRRQPGQDVLLWQTVWAPGSNPADPFLRAQVEAALDRLRKTIG